MIRISNYPVCCAVLMVLCSALGMSQPQISLLDPLDSIAGRYNSIPEQYCAFRGLIMEETDVTHYYPIVPYIYFDSGSAVIPSRYILFKDSTQTLAFDETKIPGGALDMHHHLLNILGSRLRSNHEMRISITGCTSNESNSAENTMISAQRGNVVYDYLRNVWGISADRLALLPARGLPVSPTNRKDLRGRAENRRVDIDCEVRPCRWLVQPIVQKYIRLVFSRSMIGIRTNIDTTMSRQFVEIRRNGEVWNRIAIRGPADSLIFYNWKSARNDEPPRDESDFILQYVSYDSRGNEFRSRELNIPVMYVSQERARTEFLTRREMVVILLVQGLFETDHLGEYNHGTLGKFACQHIHPISRIDIIGHRDCIGLVDRNLILSQFHAREAELAFTNRYCKGSFATKQSRGVGSMYPLYDNALPEGRRFNRSVQIVIDTPGIVDQ